MSEQAREARTGRYASRDHSDPEATLFPENDAEEAARVANVLENISVTFGQLESIAARGRDAFLGDDFILRLAAVAALIRLGEQARRLGKDFITQHRGPKYSRMGKLRDRLAHRYRSIDWDLLWNTVTRDVPQDASAHRQVEERFLRRSAPHVEQD